MEDKEKSGGSARDAWYAFRKEIDATGPKASSSSSAQRRGSTPPSTGKTPVKAKKRGRAVIDEATDDEEVEHGLPPRILRATQRSSRSCGRTGK